MTWYVIKVLECISLLENLILDKPLKLLELILQLGKRIWTLKISKLSSTGLSKGIRWKRSDSILWYDYGLKNQHPATSIGQRLGMVMFTLASVSLNVVNRVSRSMQVTIQVITWYVSKWDWSVYLWPVITTHMSAAGPAAVSPVRDAVHANIC